jgi:hypothetical protein
LGKIEIRIGTDGKIEIRIGIFGEIRNQDRNRWGK